MHGLPPIQHFCLTSLARRNDVFELSWKEQWGWAPPFLQKRSCPLDKPLTSVHWPWKPLSLGVLSPPYHKEIPFVPWMAPTIVTSISLERASIWSWITTQGPLHWTGPAVVFWHYGISLSSPCRKSEKKSCIPCESIIRVKFEKQAPRKCKKWPG